MKALRCTIGLFAASMLCLAIAAVPATASASSFNVHQALIPAAPATDSLERLDVTARTLDAPRPIVEPGPVSGDNLMAIVDNSRTTRHYEPG